MPAPPSTILSMSASAPIAARLTGGLHEPDGRFDLGPHRAGGEALGPQLVRGHGVEPALLGCSPVLVDAVDVGGHQEQVGLDLAGQQLTGQVLVDHGLDTSERALLVGHEGSRDPTPTGADHEDPVVEQPADRPDLEDPLRRRRRDHAAEMIPVTLEEPALLGGERLRLGVVVHRPDELRGVGERRIAGVDLDHGEDRGERHLGREQVAELLLDQVADHPFGLRPQQIQRIGLDVLVRRRLQGEETDLRAVAMGQHQLVVLRHRGQRLCGCPDVRPLRLGGHRLAPLQQGVATEGDEDAHRQLPSVATSSALIVCKRFSA